MKTDVVPLVAYIYIGITTMILSYSTLYDDGGLTTNKPAPESVPVSEPEPSAPVVAEPVQEPVSTSVSEPGAPEQKEPVGGKAKRVGRKHNKTKHSKSKKSNKKSYRKH